MTNMNALLCRNNNFFAIISINNLHNDFEIRDNVMCFHPFPWYSEAELDCCSVTGKESFTSICQPCKGCAQPTFSILKPRGIYGLSEKINIQVLYYSTLKNPDRGNTENLCNMNLMCFLFTLRRG